MSTEIGRPLGLLSALVVICAPACAQYSPASAEGPSLQVSAAALYDSNVSRSSKAIAAARHIVQADTSYSPSASLDLAETMGFFSAHVKGAAGYTFFQHNSILNREFVDTEAGAGMLALGCQSAVSANYSRRQSDLGDLTVQVTHNTSSTVVVRVNTTCGGAVGFAPYASAQRTWSSQSALDTSDFNSNEVSGGIAYNQPLLGKIVLFGDYQSTRFPNRRLSDGSKLTSDGYDIISGGVRYSRSIGTKFDVSAAFSYVTSTSRLPLESSFQGNTYEASIGYHPNSRLQAHLTYARDIRPSTFLNAAYSLDQSLGLGVDYKFTERLNAELRVRQSSQHLTGAALVSNVDLQSQIVNTAGASANYVIGRHLTVSLTAAFEKRHADLAGYGYSSTRFGISLTANL